MIQETFNRVVEAYMKQLEVELYAAWRSEYDFLYVNTDDSGFEPGKIPGQEFIPSNDDDRKFIGKHTTRYDVRDNHISPEGRELLAQYRLAQHRVRSD